MINDEKLSTKTLHFNQIPVSKDAYINLLNNNMPSINGGLINCMNKRKTKAYRENLLVVSSRLYELGRLVYIDNNSYSKEPSKYYELILNNYNIEYQDEYNNRVNYKFDYGSYELLIKVISNMISNINELTYMSEYAGLIDFVIKRDDNLPIPEFKNSMFVTNWEGYDPIENELTREFMDEFGLY